MPDYLQDLWVEHAANSFTGVYDRKPSKKGGTKEAARNLEKELIEKAAAKKG